MSEPWEAEQLLAPISEHQPCGEDLDYSDVLTSFDAYRLFGQSVPLEQALPPPTDPDAGEKRERDARIPKPREWPEWPLIRDRAAAGIGRSKDVRLLVILGTALLRTNGLPAFCTSLVVAAEWLERYWVDVYPRVDGDATMRRNALNGFADSMAVVEGLRRTPIISTRQLGVVTFKDLDLSTRAVPLSNEERASHDKRVTALFAATADEVLRVVQHLTDAATAVQRIERTMREAPEGGDPPSLGSLQAVLTRTVQLMKPYLPVPAAAGAAAAGDAAEGAAGGDAASVAAGAIGPIASREDAIRALDAVADFFRRTEPSSPVPLFVMRAKRLVAKDFLEVLADVVPEAVSSARLAGGVREEQT